MCQPSSPAPSSTTQIAELPEWAKPYAKETLAKGAALTDINKAPYQKYGGERIAGFQPLQQQAFKTVGGMDAGPAGFQAGIGQYMSPYMQNVVDIEKREAARQSGIMGTQQQAQATQAGAFGGGREAIMRAERERNLAQQMGDIQARGSQAAYEQAANQFRQGIQQQGAISQLQSALGAQQQQQAQRPLDVAYQDFLNQQNYPYKQLGFMSDLIRGMPLGQKSTSTVYDSGPGLAQTLAGLGGAAYGFGKSGLFGKEGGLMTSYAGGGVTSQDNKERLIDDTYSIPMLLRAKEAALNRRDVRTAEAIDERIADLNAIKAQSASLQYGLGSAFDQIPQERQEEMMAGGGMVAFAKGGDTFGTKFQESLTSLQDLASQQPPVLTPEQYEQRVTSRLPMFDRLMGEDVTKPYLEETKAKRAELAGQLEKDRGLAFAMASLKLLGRKAAPGESQQTQMIRGIGEAGDAFIGEVGRLKKENRDADDKLRQSEILLATAQQQRKEGKVKAAMDSEDKAEAKEQEAYKTRVGVQKDTAQLLSGMAQAEMRDKTQKETTAMQVAAQLEGYKKPSVQMEGVSIKAAEIRRQNPNMPEAQVRDKALKEYLSETRTGMPGVEARVEATAREKAAKDYADAIAPGGAFRKQYKDLQKEGNPEKIKAFEDMVFDKFYKFYSGTSQSAPGAAPAVQQPAPGAAQPAPVAIPPQAVDILKKAPTPQNIQYFDQTFGPGAAARVLGR